MASETKKNKPSQAMSTLMFWNKQNGNANQNGENGNGATNEKKGKKTWLHAPDALVNGHVAYLVKFLGSTPVDQAKGIDTVKEAILRLQFAQQIKKAESAPNAKLRKVEITISVDGVAVQEPKGTKILHQFPLHNISYCADEKGVKKFFSFIAKTVHPRTNQPNDDNTSNNTEETHECFVFISSKLASDITLTIGQAFELAYRRYMNEGGKSTEVSKLQTQNKQLENHISIYRQRLKDLIDLVPKSELDKILLRHGLHDILELPQQENEVSNHIANINGSITSDLDTTSPGNEDQLLIETSEKHSVPIVPPRNIQNQISSTLDALKPSVGTKLEGLLLNSDSEDDFDPRADEGDTVVTNGKHSDSSFFGFEPSKTSFGQQLFTNYPANTNGINSTTTDRTMTNGSMNGTGPSPPPPLLAPPPKASIPRRIATNGNSGTTSNQDLFGSMPFDAPINSSPFDVNSEQFTSPPSSTSLPTSYYGNDFTLPFNGLNKQNGTPINDSSSGFSSSSSMSSDNSFDNFGNGTIQENILPEIKAFANNSDKLEGVLDHLNGINISNGVQPSNTPVQSKNNPFAMIRDKSPGYKDLKLHSLTSHEINYDALRETTDFDVFNTSASGLSSEPVVEKVEKPKVAIDLFKDAAAAAFNELGGSHTNKVRKHEFYNKISEQAFASAEKGFGTNVITKNKAIAFDDFTLESLDPLRK